eukprot:SAG22_NODE_1362_length_4618_cov_3.277495_4_plen_327_part_00
MLPGLSASLVSERARHAQAAAQERQERQECQTLENEIEVVRAALTAATAAANAYDGGGYDPAPLLRQSELCRDLARQYHQCHADLERDAGLALSDYAQVAKQLAAAEEELAALEADENELVAARLAITSPSAAAAQSATTVGLPNYSNYCFMNATVQCLRHTPRLAQAVCVAVPAAGSLAPENCLQAFANLLLSMQRSFSADGVVADWRGFVAACADQLPKTDWTTSYAGPVGVVSLDWRRQRQQDGAGRANARAATPPPPPPPPPPLRRPLPLICVRPTPAEPRCLAVCLPGRRTLCFLCSRARAQPGCSCSSLSIRWRRTRRGG